MKVFHIPASERGVKDIGWLKSNFTFSFSSYQHPARAGFGLLRVFNDDFVQPGEGFGLHPHHNMEIISVLLKGSMNHKDSMGYSDVVHQDWVQIMSAGSGLRHEEYNVGTEEVNFLQIWIEPKYQNIDPRYQRRFFPKEKRKNQLITIVSPEEGTAHCRINQNAILSLGYFDKEKTLTYHITSHNKCLWLFVIEGSLNVQGAGALGKRDSLGAWETDEITLKITEDDTQFLLIEVPINR